MDSIQSLTLEKIIAGKDQATKPAFLGSTYKAGYLLLHCKDSESAEWVKSNITDSSPWEGASLMVTEECKIPHPRIAVGYFPNSRGLESKKIIDLLQGQNKGLQVNSWRLVKRMERGSQVTMVLAVDHKSAASLKEANGRVNYRFGQIFIRLKAEGVNTDALVKQMEAVELGEEDKSPSSDTETQQA